MNLFLQEYKKLLICQRGLLIVIVVCMLHIFFSVSGSTAYFILEEKYKEQYQEYLSVFGGQVTEEKKQFLLDEEKQILMEEMLFSELSNRLYSGEISVEEYDRQISCSSQVFEKKMALNQIRSRYHYAQISPENRYVTAENGWTSVFLGSGLDMVSIFGAILLVVCSFCPEYESGMYQLVCCSKKGKSRTVFLKIFSCLSVIIFLKILISLISLFIVHIKFGLSDFSYPIQSLSCFSVCPYSISIWQGWVIILSFKVFSLCLIGILTSLCCVIFKKSLVSLFVSGVLSVLPYFILEPGNLLRFVPYIGLSLGECYLSGFETVDAQTREYLMIPFPQNELFWILVVCCLTCLVCILLVLKIWNHRYYRERKRRI